MKEATRPDSESESPAQQLSGSRYCALHQGKGGEGGEGVEGEEGGKGGEGRKGREGSERDGPTLSD